MLVHCHVFQQGWDQGDTICRAGRAGGKGQERVWEVGGGAPAGGLDEVRINVNT